MDKELNEALEECRRFVDFFTTINYQLALYKLNEYQNSDFEIVDIHNLYEYEYGRPSRVFDPLNDLFMKQFVYEPEKVNLWAESIVSEVQRTILKSGILDFIEYYKSKGLEELRYQQEETLPNESQEERLEGWKVENEKADIHSAHYSLESFYFKTQQALEKLIFFTPNFVLDEKLISIKVEKQVDEMSLKIKQDLSRKVKKPHRFLQLESVANFCPELIDKLRKLEIDSQKNILHLITGVNRDDCYQYIYTAKYRKLNSEEKKEITTLLTELNAPK